LYQKKFYASEAAFNAGTVKETQTLTFDAFGRELSTQWKDKKGSEDKKGKHKRCQEPKNEKS
jgi:hypothetical protein